MGDVPDFLLNLLSQFAGGPGPPENNLVRFGLAAMLWAALLLTAWSRRQAHSRERLLVIGFGLALFRELFKFTHLSYKLITGADHGLICALIAPMEHALTLISIVLIAAAYLRYILDDDWLARRYLTLGMGATAVMVMVTALWWPQQLVQLPDTQFHETWPAAAIHLVGSLLILAALAILWRRRVWRHAVVAALALLLISELLTFVNFVTTHWFTTILCPVGNAIYLIAIPLFGHVYYRERQNEQQRAEAALRSYRDHLEEMVKARTSEISCANTQLKTEIAERKLMEKELARRNRELAAQNAIAATISQSLALDQVLEAALVRTVDLMGMEYGCVHLLNAQTGQLELRTVHTTGDRSGNCTLPCCVPECDALSQQTMTAGGPVLMDGEKASNGREKCMQTKVSTPLVSQGNPLGTLTLGSPQPNAFPVEALNLLQAIGQQIGVAVEKANLHQEVERTATLEERQRIAAEMHDGLAQTLSYIGHKTDSVPQLVAAGQIHLVNTVCREIRQAVTQAGIEVRRAIASLQERPAPRLSLQDAIRRTVAGMATETVPRIEVHDLTGEPITYPPEDLEQVLKVVQEALLNAIRHARARSIDVRLQRNAQEITIIVQDDGCGFDPAAPVANQHNHFGLSIMSARAARIGAALTIEARQGKGVNVTLAIPYKEDT